MVEGRKIYLINPKFQLKFSLLITFLLFLSSIIYPITIYDLIERIVLEIPGESVELGKKYEDLRQSLLIFLGIWQVLFTGLVFVICIFFSHKIAGPIYKLRKYLFNIKSGQGRERLRFRKSDYFPELAEDFNATFDIIQKRYNEDLIYLGEISSYLNNISMVVPEDKKEIISEINKKLADIQARFNI